MCRDSILPQPSAATTVVQGIDNGQHRLRLNGKRVKNLKAIVIYEPALK
jgi:hypothetical protein